MARALIIDSCWHMSAAEPGITDRDQRNLANLSVSPLSSRVSQTCATCCGENCSDGIGAADDVDGEFIFDDEEEESDDDDEEEEDDVDTDDDGRLGLGFDVFGAGEDGCCGGGGGGGRAASGGW